MVVGHVKDWLEQAITNGTNGNVTHVIVVAGQTYRIDTTTAGLYNWRRRLCASAETSTALRAPSWDPKNHKARFMFMLPSWPAWSWPSSPSWTGNFKQPSPTCPWRPSLDAHLARPS